LGFCPFSLFATTREEEKGKWGRRKEERGSEAAPVTPPTRQGRRPHQSPRGKKRRPSASGKKPDRSRDQDAAVHIYVAVNTNATPPSTSSRP
jgi:hypothetical protein